MIRRSWWPLVLVTALAGCDLSTEFDSAGTFTGTITGDLTANLAGTALFGVLSNEFSLVMSDPDDAQGVAVGRPAGRPGPGTYTIEHFDAASGFIATYARDGTPAGVFRAEGGQIEVTSSSASRLQGSLSFDAVGHLESDPDTELSITVNASFDARCVQAGGSTCN